MGTVVETSETNPENPSTSEKEKYANEQLFQRRYLRTQWALVIVGLGVGAIAYCNLNAIDQTLTEARRQVAAANTANTQNAANNKITLQAYVTLGDAKGVVSEPYKLVGKDKFEIPLNVHNSGQTPAFHFAARFLDRAQRLNFRERWYDPISKSTEGGGLNLPDLTVASQTTVTPLLTYDGPLKQGSVINVFFEYCDVFGQYWCNGFLLKVTEGNKLESYLATPCFADPYAQAPTGNAFAGKKSEWHRLPRCGQEGQVTQDQGGTYQIKH